MDDSKAVSLEEAVKTVNNGLSGEGTFESFQLKYSERSNLYDEQHRILKIVHPRIAAELTLKHIRNVDTTTLLDVATGTGNIPLILRKENFLGHIDLLDANVEMLDVASKKEIKPRNVILHTLKGDGSMPLKRESYDVVTCLGSMYVNNVPASSLKDFLDVLKPGGCLVFNLVDLESPYCVEIESIIDTLVSSKKMKLVEMKKFNSIESPPYFPSVMYIYKKI